MVPMYVLMSHSFAQVHEPNYAPAKSLALAEISQLREISACAQVSGSHIVQKQAEKSCTWQMPTGRRDAQYIPTNLMSQTLAVPQPLSRGDVRGGFIWLRLLPAVPRAPSLNITSSSLVSLEEA